ncbi:hypothetical protein K443DRAFT_222917 [Laccaria amethystina LaAM-08-1]|uniref:Uncharacterized protein n=1 Tax=Laccaria amethystina LaAM-08-1 TaxID=1095629 RepID=A0A0C9WYX8_9AGAR|nr:hypothetical protein K443DRAFT_222917 [Laccaria amethystina LaAM-08-1]
MVKRPPLESTSCTTRASIMGKVDEKVYFASRGNRWVVCLSVTKIVIVEAWAYKGVGYAYCSISLGHVFDSS